MMRLSGSVSGIGRYGEKTGAIGAWKRGGTKAASVWTAALRWDRAIVALLNYLVGLLAGAAWIRLLESRIVRSGGWLLWPSPSAGSAGVHIGRAVSGGLPVLRRLPHTVRAHRFTATRKVAGLPAGPPL